MTTRLPAKSQTASGGVLLLILFLGAGLLFPACGGDSSPTTPAPAPAPPPPPPPAPEPSNSVIYEVGDRIPFPPGIANRFVQIGLQFSGGELLLLTASRGGYVEWSGSYRFTCVATRCEVVDGVVSTGRIARTPAGQEPD